MSAAEQLPVEVLGLIFTTFNDHHPNASVVITAVCQTWRRVALATPTAWQNVCIDLNRLAIFPRMADFLLKRSRGCLVNVEIVGECHLSLIQDPLIPDLQVHLDRFRTLCVEPTRDGILNGIAGGLAGQAPNLKYLKAAGQFWHAYRAFAQVTNLSQLKQVAFTGCILPFPSTLFHGLIHLTLISPVPPTSVMMTTRALQACPDLESFTFEGVAHWDVSPSVSSAMLFKLRNLNLTLDDATILLPQIHAPSLQELTLHSSMSKRDDRMTLTLYSFLVHSCGPLTRLHVDNVGISPDGWVRCLSVLPHLEVLTSRDDGFSDQVLEALRVERGRHVLCPRLHTWTTTWNFSMPKVLINFLRSRNPPRTRPGGPPLRPTSVSCIKNFEIQGPRPNDAVIRQIQFLMVDSDPMPNGILEHTFGFLSRY